MSSICWIELGITPELIHPGRPQQNGRHERMHRTLKRESTRPPRTGLRAQQIAFNSFRRVFNEKRRHQALDQRTPAVCYEPSSTPYPRRPPPMVYPDHFEVRWTSQLGNIRWKARFVWATKLLAFQHLGLEQIGDGLWAVYFGPKHLGWLDELDFRIMHLRRRSQPR